MSFVPIQYFRVTGVEVSIRPRSRAHATVFWFLTGIHPDRIVCDVTGKVNFAMPSPFMPLPWASVNIEREGSLCN